MSRKPIVIGENGTRIPFTYFQLCQAKMCLGLMTKGIKFRGVTVGTIKKALNLNGRTASELLPQVEALIEKYKQETAPLLNTSKN